MERNIKMVNEITYEEGSIEKNIFAEFPFVFPDSTPSAVIKKEQVDRQAYSAQIEVPGSCQNCYYMFKMSYHPNWDVKVDGQSVEKYAVFPMYVAAKAAPGTHTVEVTHKPNSLKVILLVLEIIVLPLIFIFKKNRFF